MQKSLFESAPQMEQKTELIETINLDPGTLWVYHSVLPLESANGVFERLQEQLNWTQPLLSMHGKRIAVPRKQVWMGDPLTHYTYSQQRFEPEPWHQDVLVIKSHIEPLLERTFNSALCNLYRNGQDSVAWHADDELELDNSAVIASYSLGAGRSFQLKPKHDKANATRHRLQLTHNSLVVMSPEVQQFWLHQVPKTRKVDCPRINLTFRQVLRS